MAKPKKPALDRLPPHSPEAEAGVLGCCLLQPNLIDGLDFNPDRFYDLRHRDIFITLKKLREKRVPIDLITVHQRLKNKGLLEQVGGIEYIGQLQDAVPSAANIDYYTAILIEKWEMRTIIERLSWAVGNVYQYDGHLEDLKFGLKSDLDDILNGGEKKDGDSHGWDDLLEFTTANDKNNVIGVQDGKTTRWLCKGHSAWLIGPSGVGKSSLLFQMGASWACGRSIFGITPQKPLRVLVVQAENDTGDMAEMTAGIDRGLRLPFDEKTVRENIRVRSVDGKIGQAFCGWLRREIESYRADLVLVDPLLSFAGIDVSRQDQVSQFCRVWLGPVLRDTGAVLISAHHTGKPQRQDAKARPQTLTDMAYAGIGSSELVNWARAVMLLERVDDNAFRLQLAKRGKRARATHPNGEPTECIWLRHATDGTIFWEQMDAPAEEEDGKRESKPAQKRISKPEQIVACGLGLIVDAMTAPVGLNELIESIRDHVKPTLRDTVSYTTKGTWITAVEILVKNGAIKWTKSGYLKA